MVKNEKYSSVWRDTLRRIVLIVNGTLLCVMLILFCVLSVAISVTLSLTDYIILKLKGGG